MIAVVDYVDAHTGAVLATLPLNGEPNKWGCGYYAPDAPTAAVAARPAEPSGPIADAVAVAA